jgi:hypothetical protein
VNLNAIEIDWTIDWNIEIGRAVDVSSVDVHLMAPSYERR